MSAPRTFLIVGGGLAGATAASTLREDGFDGRIVVLASEREEPYHRPPLSKEYLRGEDADLPVYPPAQYREQQIELRLGETVSALDTGAREVVLEGGERIAYDALLLATGSEPRTLTLPGAELAGVHYLRTHPDSDALRAALAGSPRVAVIGAGWIGCEVAASARALGCEVTVVAPEAAPLERMLGSRIGGVYAEVHREHGVQLLLEHEVQSLAGAGRVERITLMDGTQIDCDLVVAGIGASPRVSLAQGAGIAVDNGVLVDGRLATDAPGVFAAGDIANVPYPLYGGRRIRVEHWANAQDQGPAAARAMLGSTDAWNKVPYFFSDQYDVGMEFAGDIVGADRTLVRGDLDAREAVVFWLAGERLVAGMNINVWDVSDPVQKLIARGGAVDEHALSDPGVSLAELAGDG